MDEKRKLIFFIIDGCSSYYLKEIPDLPGLNLILKHGKNAEYAKPIFPSLSLPNYYSMFTGLYPEDHGIFSNEMYDKNSKEKFKITYKENRDRWFQEAPETLWMKAGRLGIRTCLYWPWFINFNSPYSTGKHMHCGESFQTFSDKWHGDQVEFEKWMDQKFNEIVEKLKDPCDQFIVIYWGPLDEVAHKRGPRSKEAIDDLKLADKWLFNLQEKLERLGLMSKVDLFVAADHGQLHSPKENHIYMDRHLGMLIMSGDIEAWCEGEAYLAIHPASGKEDSVFEAIKDMKIDHVTVYKNTELPDRLRVKKAPKAPPIWILADPGYSLVDSSASFHDLGIHGYDNECESMRGICMGRGPNIEKDPTILDGKPIITVDYFDIMCKILNVKRE